MPSPCRHPHALGIEGSDGWPSAKLCSLPYPTIDRWCPTCGAVRIWKNDNGRTEWRRPRADGGKTGGR